jgi:hypothetical protein
VIRRAACSDLRAGGEGRELPMHIGGPGLWTGRVPMLSRTRPIGSVFADAPTQAL